MSSVLPKSDFPIFSTGAASRPNARPLVYLDSAATSQKPRVVLAAMQNFYQTSNANVHRGVHELSVRATRAYDAARATVQDSIGAADPAEIIFTRNATEALNLVAESYGVATLKPGDEVIISELEHHSNIVPWQVAAKKTGAKLRVWKLRDGQLDPDDLQKLLSDKSKVVAVTHVSNVLGTTTPLKSVIAAAHAVGAVVVVDGAQAVGHQAVDVQSLDCDFYAFSGHKAYGPMGIGVLYGKRALLERMPPYQTGGDMVERVSMEETTYAPLPQKFEAGTANVAGAIGLAAALTYIEHHGLQRIAEHEHRLAKLAQDELSRIPGVTLVGGLLKQPGRSGSFVTFDVKGVHPHDVGTILDREGVAIRTGLLCAEPLVRSLGYEAVCRASFAGYNDESDVAALVAGVKKAAQLFAPKKAQVKSEVRV